MYQKNIQYKISKMIITKKYIIDKVYMISMILNNNNGDFVDYDFINNSKNLSNIIDSIKEISELINWKDFIKINFNEKYNSNIDFYLYYFEVFNKLKNNYDSYFNKISTIVDSNYDFILSIILFITFPNDESINLCKKINFVKDDVNICQILQIICSKNIIWKDKIEKGIITEKKYKNDVGEIIKVDYEENKDIYDFYYGDLF